MIRKSREIPKDNKQQLATCLSPINAYKMSTTTTMKSHTAALTPCFGNGGCSGVRFGRRNPNVAAAAMAADKFTTSTTKQTTPPMDAVVVNSIIYSKPAFCGIVVDIGGMENPSATATGSVTNTTDKSSRINKPALPSLQTAGNGGFFPLSTADNQKDGHIYMMSTTMNGSIHHQISEMCDNLLSISMGLFGMVANSEHVDDSLIEFAYDDTDDEDGIEFLHTDEDYKRHEVYNDDDDDEDDEEDDDDDDDESDDDDKSFEEYETDDENYCLSAGEDVTDFSKGPALTRPLMYNCNKKKKVRFNDKPTVHVMHTWNYAYRAARKGEWEMYARDRERFKLRIQRAALTLNPILDREHRLQVYEQRFASLYADQEDAKTKETPQPKKTNQKQKHRKKRRKRRRPNF